MAREHSASAAHAQLPRAKHADARDRALLAAIAHATMPFRPAARLPAVALSVPTKIVTGIGIAVLIVLLRIIAAGFTHAAGWHPLGYSPQISPRHGTNACPFPADAKTYSQSNEDRAIYQVTSQPPKARPRPTMLHPTPRLITPWCVQSESSKPTLCT